MNKKVIAFDLDDTLYKEIDYVKSAFNYISMYLQKKFRINTYHLHTKALEHESFNFYDIILDNSNLNQETFTLSEYLNLYRFHFPEIKVEKETIRLLKKLKQKSYGTAIITNGRSITQRNKIKALKIEQFFDCIIISEETGKEKPNPDNYRHIEKQFESSHEFYFIGDNPKIDFDYPNRKSNWTSLCLENSGYNIHHQNLNSIDNRIILIKRLTDILELI